MKTIIMILAYAATVAACGVIAMQTILGFLGLPPFNIMEIVKCIL